jgi:uncharacterized membrane protein
MKMVADWSFYLALFCMGLATYGTRLAGYWLLQGVEIKGRLRAAMDAVPPAILTAVIAPAVFLNGKAEMIAGAVTLVAAVLRLPLLLVIAVGVVTVAILRLYV